MSKACLFAVIAICVAGCASTSGAAGDAEAPPEWFEQRQAELAREGFPELGRVPTIPVAPPEETPENLADSKTAKSVAIRRKTALRLAMLKDPRAEPATLTPEEIQEWGDELKAQLAGKPAPADFLSDQEVASLRAKFDRPRARR